MDKVLIRNIVLGLAVLLTVVAIVMFMMNRTRSPRDDMGPALDILKDFFFAMPAHGDEMLEELANIQPNISVDFVDKLRALKLKQNSSDPDEVASADIELVNLLVSLGIDREQLK